MGSRVTIDDQEETLEVSSTGFFSREPPSRNQLPHLEPFGSTRGNPTQARPGHGPGSTLGDFVPDANPTSDVWGGKVPDKKTLKREQEKARREAREHRATGMADEDSQLDPNAIVDDKVWLKTPSGNWFITDKVEPPPKPSLPKRKYAEELEVQTFTSTPINAAEFLDTREAANRLANTRRRMVNIATCPELPEYMEGEDYYRLKIRENINDYLTFVEENHRLQSKITNASITIKDSWKLYNLGRVAFYEAYDTARLNTMTLEELKTELRVVQEDAREAHMATHMMRVRSEMLEVIQADEANLEARRRNTPHADQEQISEDLRRVQL